MLRTAIVLLAWPVASLAADLQVSVQDLGAHPLMDAVIYADPVGTAAPSPSSAAHAQVDQVNKEFVPLVTVVRAGTEVFFPNSDNIRHSIYSFSPTKPFATKLYSGRQAPPVTFDRPGVVSLGCNIHDAMAAWVVVVDTPYFAKTAATGIGVLKGLSAGDYHVSVWYPGSKGAAAVNDVHVSADSEAHLDITIDSSDSPLPALRARANPQKVLK
jgi:plastocyanin